MRQVLEVLAFAVALLVVAGTILSAVRAIVLPRATQNRVPAAAVRMVRGVLRIRAKRMDTYEDRDRVMAMVAPVALLLTLAIWLMILVAAYSVMFFATSGRSWVESMELSGSSVFTLGTSADSHFGPSVITYSEAGLGLLIVALFITYFPTIYNAFSRRESGVSLLEVRAGDPPQATTMLIRFHRIDEPNDRLSELWAQWEMWFTEIEESHTTFPILVFFRSPQPHRSWVTAAGTLMDAAAFWTACCEHPPDAAVQLALRSGFLCLRRIADAFSIPYDPNPSPDDPITISRSEWDEAMTQMAAAGVPLKDDWDQAWIDWCGWRVNYDAVLLRLARLVEAPPAPWVSDRSPVLVRASGALTPSARKPSGPRRWPRRSPAGRR
jgi:ABC-type multidrug transport system fused ATPase/permease subunit